MQLNQRLNPVVDLERMAEESEEFWRNLLKKYLVDGPSVVVRAKPSKEEQAKLSKEEDDRIEQQRKTLGPEGLKQKEKGLNEAIEKNDIPPPDEMLTELPIPDITKIHFHSIKSYTTEGKQPEKFDLQQVPIYACLDDVKTNFVYVSKNQLAFNSKTFLYRFYLFLTSVIQLVLLIDTHALPAHLQPYLVLFLESILESPIQRGDQLIPFEDVVAELEGDTIACETRIGLDKSNRFTCGPYCHSASLILQVRFRPTFISLNILTS